MVIVIVGVLSASGVFLLTYLVESSAKVPSQLNMDMVASDLLDTMVEGDSQAKGLRFCQAVTAISSTQINFVNQDAQNIQYRLGADAKMYRKIGTDPERVIPYYAATGVFVLGDQGKVFRFYNASDAEISSGPQNVRRIAIAIIAQTTAGTPSDWDGRSKQSSSVAVHRF